MGLEQGKDKSGALQLVLYWRAKADISEDYSIFVHWLDGSGQVVAQSDATPNGGLSPTSLWRSGDVVRDTYAMPPAASTGSIVGVRLGVYRLPTLERLVARQAEQHLPDAAVTLRLEEIASADEQDK